MKKFNVFESEIKSNILNEDIGLTLLGASLFVGVIFNIDRVYSVSTGGVSLVATTASAIKGLVTRFTGLGSDFGREDLNRFVKYNKQLARDVKSLKSLIDDVSSLKDSDVSEHDKWKAATLANSIMVSVKCIADIGKDLKKEANAIRDFEMIDDLDKTLSHAREIKKAYKKYLDPNIGGNFASNLPISDQLNLIRHKQSFKIAKHALDKSYDWEK
jgi:hypothetical protein